MMIVKLNDYILEIMKKLEDEGFQAFLVGGCLRDILMGFEPTDYDVTTDAKPDEIERIFSDKSTISVGKKFGTIIVVNKGNNIEVTTFRSDGKYLDGRRPEEIFYSKSVEDDLMRRDFTINSMAWNAKRGLIDIFGGSYDLKNGILKTVGNPDDRFSEDYLRILRCVRFASRFNFSIDELTFEGLLKNAKHINLISNERIRDELFKIINSKYVDRGFKILSEINILKYISDDLYDFSKLKNFEEILEIMAKMPNDLTLRLSILLFYTRNPDEILKNLNCSNELIKTIREILMVSISELDVVNKTIVKKVMKQVSLENIRYSIELDRQINGVNSKNIEFEKLLKNVLLYKEPYKISHLAIGGNDIKLLGLRGIEIGEALNYSLDRVVETPSLNDKDALIEIIRDKFVIDK